MPRKIIVDAAVSADGFIARPDGDFSWIPPSKDGDDSRLASFFESVDTLVMGRKTHDIAVRYGQASTPGKQSYVFTRTPRESAWAGVEFVNEDAGTFASRLRAAGGKDIFLMGGSEIIASFLDAGEVDEIIMTYIPILIGEGIPLIAPRHRSIPLERLSSTPGTDGTITLHYRLIK